MPFTAPFGPSASSIAGTKEADLPAAKTTIRESIEWFRLVFYAPKSAKVNSLFCNPLSMEMFSSIEERPEKRKDRPRRKDEWFSPAVTALSHRPLLGQSEGMGDGDVARNLAWILSLSSCTPERLFRRRRSSKCRNSTGVPMTSRPSAIFLVMLRAAIYGLRQRRQC